MLTSFFADSLRKSSPLRRASAARVGSERNTTSERAGPDTDRACSGWSPNLDVININALAQEGAQRAFRY